MNEVANYTPPFDYVGDKIMNVSTVYADAARAAEAKQESFPLDMPKSAAYGYAAELARDTGAPYGYAYAAILTLFSGAGVKCHKVGEPIVTRLYTALIAQPGFGKSRMIKRLKMSLPHKVTSIIEESAPVSAPGLAMQFGPGKDDPPIDSPGYKVPNCCLVLDELRGMMANLSIPGSGTQFASHLCTLFYEDTGGGSADKRGMRKYKVNLSILGCLMAKTPEDFRKSFCAETQGGLYDRYIFVPGPPTHDWDDTWEPPYDDISIGDEPQRPEPLSTDVEITREALAMKKEWVDAAPMVFTGYGDAEKANRMRLGEIALRIAAISASINGDKTTTRECMQAALAFMEWQERVRKVYKPSEGDTIDDQFAVMVEETLRKEQAGKPKNYFSRWTELADRNHWYRSHAACMKRVKDTLIDAGLVECKVIDEDPKTGNIKYDKRLVRWASAL